jgi:hypothetical protein
MLSNINQTQKNKLCFLKYAEASSKEIKWTLTENRELLVLEPGEGGKREKRV